MSPDSDQQAAQPVARRGCSQAEPQTESETFKPPPLSKARKNQDAASQQAAEPVEVPNNALEALPVYGYEHSADQRWTVYQLGVSLALAALFGAVPAVLDMVAHVQAVESAGISRWTWVLLLTSGIQLAYAVYLFQLPDWSSVWTVSIVMLAFATAYAMLLGLLMLADNQSQLVRFLELTDARASHKAPGWCLIMLSICSLLAYFCGRISARWQHAYRMATEDAAGGG